MKSYIYVYDYKDENKGQSQLVECYLKLKSGQQRHRDLYY